MNTFTRKDVEVISKDTLFSGYAHLYGYQLRHRKFNGEISPVIHREVLDRGNSVVCLPYDPLRDEVVLVEQFRPGAYAAGVEKCWLTEAVAGIVKQGEILENVAVRECLEETGCHISQLTLMGNFMPSAGGSSELCVIFVGRCDSSHISEYHGLEHEAEDIRTFTLPFKEAYRLAKDGKFVSLPLVCALFFLASQKNDLCKLWSA